ncbi:MAG: GYF domain-containing protein [Pirellulales bacterium]
MAIEIICRGCAKKLRVGDEHAGKVARCPECGGLNPIGVEAAAAVASPSPSSPPLGGWLVRADQGQVYGPISRGELESWVQQGRIAGTFQIAQEGAEQWRPASEQFPQLAQAWSSGTGNPWSAPPGGSAAGGGVYPADARPYQANSPYEAASPYLAPQYGGVSYARPHRGAMVLVLAILGWVFCVLLGGIAFFMGWSDVREMRAGRMDPSGMTMTQAGMYIGLANLVITLAAFGFMILMIILEQR